MINYISIKQVIDNLLDHPLLKDLSLERVINYTVEFIRIIGSPPIFEERIVLVDIKNYRGLLPCDLNQIIQVRLNNQTNKPTFRYSGDNFHYSESKENTYELTYKVQNSVIFTSIKEGQVEISYQSIATDSEGYPLIPDNSSFIRALELYIKKKYFTILLDLNKISPSAYQNVQQEYAWAVGQAQSDLIRPTIDQMQMITNQLTTLLIRDDEHSNGFINNNNKEHFKTH